MIDPSDPKFLTPLLLRNLTGHKNFAFLLFSLQLFKKILLIDQKLRKSLWQDLEFKSLMAESSKISSSIFYGIVRPTQIKKRMRQDEKLRNIAYISSTIYYNYNLWPCQ